MGPIGIGVLFVLAVAIGLFAFDLDDKRRQRHHRRHHHRATHLDFRIGPVSSKGA